MEFCKRLGPMAAALIAFGTAAMAQQTAQPATGGQGSAAGTTGGVLIELNKLQPVENACRIYLLLRNETHIDFDGLQLELVSFDADGVISQRVAVDLAPLPAGKTLVKLFDVPETRCESVSRLLLNDALDCRSAAGAVPDCLAQLRPSSRAKVEFWK